MKLTRSCVAALALVACTKTPAYLYGRDFSDLKLGTLTGNEGIYPDTSILDDPNNPFAFNPPSDTGKWDLQASASPIVAFYSWATLNALSPSGETQFYVGKNLEAINTTAPAEELSDRAIRAFQAVLANFPTSVTYESDGKTTLSLATLSCQGIHDLNGMLPSGWTLVNSLDNVPECLHP
jgi:hypothetical protein